MDILDIAIIACFVALIFGIVSIFRVKHINKKNNMFPMKKLSPITEDYKYWITRIK